MSEELEIVKPSFGILVSFYAWTLRLTAVTGLCLIHVVSSGAETKFATELVHDAKCCRMFDGVGTAVISDFTQSIDHDHCSQNFFASIALLPEASTYCDSSWGVRSQNFSGRSGSSLSNAFCSLVRHLWLWEGFHALSIDFSLLFDPGVVWNRVFGQVSNKRVIDDHIDCWRSASIHKYRRKIPNDETVAINIVRSAVIALKKLQSYPRPPIQVGLLNAGVQGISGYANQIAGLVDLLSQFGHLFSHFLDHFCILSQLSLIEHYQSLGLPSSGLHFTKLSLKNLSLAKKDIGCDASDEQDSEGQFNNRFIMQFKIGPFLLFLFVMVVMMSCYFLGVWGLFLACSRDNWRWVFFGNLCVLLAIAGVIQVVRILLNYAARL
jgi:hypothetical protein